MGFINNIQQLLATPLAVTLLRCYAMPGPYGMYQQLPQPHRLRFESAPLRGSSQVSTSTDVDPGVFGPFPNTIWMRNDEK